MQQDRVEMTEKADQIRHFIPVRRTGQKWHCDQAGGGDKSEQSHRPRLTAAGSGKVMIGHGVNHLRGVRLGSSN
jgi:hypothetical protein